MREKKVTPKFIGDVRTLLEALIDIAEEYAILYEDGLNVSPEERVQNTRVRETEEIIGRVRKFLRETDEYTIGQH